MSTLDKQDMVSKTNPPNKPRWSRMCAVERVFGDITAKKYKSTEVENPEWTLEPRSFAPLSKTTTTRRVVIQMALASPPGSHTQQDFIRLKEPAKDSCSGRLGSGPVGQDRRPTVSAARFPAQSTDGCQKWRADHTQYGSTETTSLAATTGCPWLQPGKKYNRGIVGLHEEIEDFYQYMSPTVSEHRMRSLVFKSIREVIIGLWKEARVFIFGSFETGLYLPTSDIDVVVIGKWRTLPLEMLRDALVRSGICDYDSVKVLDKAAVPIIKLTEWRSKVKVDISFNMSNGLVSANRIKQLIAELPHITRLVMVLKQFLLQRELNEVFTGGVSSYSLILMVVSFLQTHERHLGVFPGCNLGVLLIEFFELYGVKFSYHNTCIRVRERGYAPRVKIEAQFVGQSAHSSPLSIEDPHNSSNDIGRSSYHMLKVKQAFRHAYHLLRFSVLEPGSTGDVNRRSLLGRIVTVPERVDNYRRWIQANYPSPDEPRLELGPSAPETAVPTLPETMEKYSGCDAFVHKQEYLTPATPFSGRKQRTAFQAEWWTPACRSAITARQKAHKLYRRCSNDENLVAYKKARAFARRTIREAKEAVASNNGDG